MDSSSVINGKVYAFHVKATEKRDWDALDIAYGVVYQGNDGLTFTQFKYISENLNKKKFLSSKVNATSDSSCSWAEVTFTLESWPMVGKPSVVCVNPPVTFYQLGRILYDRKLFTDPVGITRLDKAKAIAANTDGSNLSGKIDTGKTIIEKAKNNSASVKAGMSSVSTVDLAQGDLQLIGLHGHLKGGGQHDSVGSGVADQTTDKNTDKQLLDEYKGRLSATEEMFANQTVALANKDKEIVRLQNLLDESEANLAIAKAAQTSFMAVGDKAALERKRVTDSTADDIITALKPFFKQQLAPLTQSVDNLVDNIPKNFSLLDSQLVAVMETTSDSLETISDEVVKLRESCSSVTSSIRSIETSLPSSSSPPSPTGTPEPVHPPPCNFQLDEDQPGILLCSLGCGQTLHLAGSRTSPDFSVPPPQKPTTSAPFLPSVVSTPVKSKLNSNNNLGVKSLGVTKSKNNMAKQGNIGAVVQKHQMQNKPQQISPWQYAQPQQASFQQYHPNYKPQQNVYHSQPGPSHSQGQGPNYGQHS